MAQDKLLARVGMPRPGRRPRLVARPRRARRRRILVGSLAVILALVLVAGLLAVWTVRRSWPRLDGSFTLDGLQAPVTVYRDAHGIPQLYAETAADLFRAQGYVHAQDRFWEMDFRRKTTAGRLSELFGESTLEVDRVVRTLGWRRVAAQELELLSPEARGYLEAYAAGVNDWLAGRSGSELSLEYAVLGLTTRGYDPEPWSPVDSLAWLKAMAWDLRSNLEHEIARSIAAGKVPLDRVEQLWPDYPYAAHLPIVDGGTVQGGVFIPEQEAAPSRDAGERLTAPTARPARATTAGVTGALRAASAALHAVPRLLGGGRAGPDAAAGSNSWVVAGGRTTTGKPILANDPHLGPRIPSIWYQAGLHCRKLTDECPFDVTGFTFSGMPGVIIGHNQRIAWGFTNLGPDVTDLFIEHVRGEEYAFKGAWQPIRSRTETIEVAGGDPVTLRVRATHHGPIVSEVMTDAAQAGKSAPASVGEPLLPEGESYQVSLRWTALDPGRTGEAVFLLNKAESWEEFRAAATFFEVPSQNLVYADVDGNIGYQAPGRIPVRAAGDGRWPAAGWTGAAEWTGDIPFGALPSVLNPEEGYIVAANQAVTGPGYPFLLTSDWSYGYRAKLITDALQKTQKVDLKAMARLQTDTRNAMAQALVPHLLRVKVPAALHDAQKLLDGWDGSQPPGSAPAAYFNAVWRHLLIRTFNDELPKGARPEGGGRWYAVVEQLLDNPNDPWWDDAATPDRVETRDDVLTQAMLLAHDELSTSLGSDPTAWRWGDLHTLQLTNETFGESGIAVVEWLFNRGPLRLGGNEEAVDATGWNPQTGYEVDWVPSMRMLVDLADLDRSRWVNLTGASGHAFAPTYADQAQAWAAGETTPMRSSEPAVRRAAEHTLTLEP